MPKKAVVKSTTVPAHTKKPSIFRFKHQRGLEARRKMVSPGDEKSGKEAREIKESQEVKEANEVLNLYIRESFDPESELGSVSQNAIVLIKTKDNDNSNYAHYQVFVINTGVEEYLLRNEIVLPKVKGNLGNLKKYPRNEDGSIERTKENTESLKSAISEILDRVKRKKLYNAREYHAKFLLGLLAIGVLLLINLGTDFSGIYALMFGGAGVNIALAPKAPAQWLGGWLNKRKKYDKFRIGLSKGVSACVSACGTCLSKICCCCSDDIEPKPNKKKGAIKGTPPAKRNGQNGNRDFQYTVKSPKASPVSGVKGKDKADVKLAADSAKNKDKDELPHVVLNIPDLSSEGEKPAVAERSRKDAGEKDGKGAAERKYRRDSVQERRGSQTPSGRPRKDSPESASQSDTLRSPAASGNSGGLHFSYSSRSPSSLPSALGSEIAPAMLPSEELIVAARPPQAPAKRAEPAVAVAIQAKRGSISMMASSPANRPSSARPRSGSAAAAAPSKRPVAVVAPSKRPKG